MLYENLDAGLDYGYDAVNKGLVGAWQKSNSPIFDTVVKQATDYASPAKAAQLRGQALADVSQQIGSSQQATNRNLARMGIDPNSGAFAKAQGGLGLQAALAKTNAITNAQNNWEKTSFDMAGKAAGLVGEQGKVNAALLTTGANLGLGRDRLNKDWVTSNRKVDADIAQAAASSANASVNAQIAAANSALAARQFEWNKDQALWQRGITERTTQSNLDTAEVNRQNTIWAQTNMTPYQAATIKDAQAKIAAGQELTANDWNNIFKAGTTAVNAVNKLLGNGDGGSSGGGISTGGGTGLTTGGGTGATPSGGVDLYPTKPDTGGLPAGFGQQPAPVVPIEIDSWTNSGGSSNESITDKEWV